MPPAIPLATYRLQLTADFDFDKAAAVVPYLKALGITAVGLAAATAIKPYFGIENVDLVFLTAVVNFLIIAAALYFCIVMPINKMNERRAAKLGTEDLADEAEDPQLVLLKEIRDAISAPKGDPRV